MPGPAMHIPRRTVIADLRDMPFHRLPSSDLALIVRAPSAEVIPAIPWKPSPRVFVVDPALFAPERKGQRSIDAEIIQPGIMPLWAQPGMGEPASGELIRAIGEIFASEYAHFQHLPGRPIRFEVRMKISSGRNNEIVHVIFLHPVVNDNSFRSHRRATPPVCRLPKTSRWKRCCLIMPRVAAPRFSVNRSARNRGQSYVFRSVKFVAGYPSV